MPCQRCGGMWGYHDGLCVNCADFLGQCPSPPQTCPGCGKVWPWHGGRCPDCHTPIPYWNPLDETAGERAEAASVRPFVPPSLN